MVVLQEDSPLYLEKHPYRKVTFHGTLIARGRERLREIRPNMVVFLFIEKSRLQGYFSFFSLHVSSVEEVLKSPIRNPDKLGGDTP